MKSSKSRLITSLEEPAPPAAPAPPASSIVRCLKTSRGYMCLRPDGNLVSPKPGAPALEFYFGNREMCFNFLPHTRFCYNDYRAVCMICDAVFYIRPEARPGAPAGGRGSRAPVEPIEKSRMTRIWVDNQSLLHNGPGGKAVLWPNGSYAQFHHGQLHGGTNFIPAMLYIAPPGFSRDKSPIQSIYDATDAIVAAAARPDDKTYVELAAQFGPADVVIWARHGHLTMQCPFVAGLGRSLPRPSLIFGRIAAFIEDETATATIRYKVAVVPKDRSFTELIRLQKRFISNPGARFHRLFCRSYESIAMLENLAAQAKKVKIEAL